MTYQDILLNKTTQDIQIVNGDFLVGLSEQQEADLILNVFPGNFFQWPQCGVGIVQYLGGDESATVLENLIKIQMQNDGFIVDNININGSGFDNIDINLQAHRP